MLDTKSVSLSKHNVKGQTALHLGVMGTIDDPKMIEFLLSEGMNVDTLNEVKRYFYDIFFHC